MTLAANDETKAVETAQPEATSAPQTNVDTKTDVKTDVAKTDVAKPEGARSHASRQPSKYHVRGYEADEAKARRIAARYGIYW
jgi:hypothetical protein